MLMESKDVRTDGYDSRELRDMVKSATGPQKFWLPQRLVTYYVSIISLRRLHQLIMS